MGGKKEIVTGNVFDKYNTKNPVYRRLMKGFLNSFLSLINDEHPLLVLEAGCGEGMLAEEIISNKNISKYYAFDIDQNLVNNLSHQNPKIAASRASIYDLTEFEKINFDYVIASEVLEHIEFPEKAIEQLKLLNTKYFLFSVPREPVWRILNVARLKYISQLGNTPGHLQHWSRKSFLKLMESNFRVREFNSPLPWTIALCTK